MRARVRHCAPAHFIHAGAARRRGSYHQENPMNLQTSVRAGAGIRIDGNGAP